MKKYALLMRFGSTARFYPKDGKMFTSNGKIFTTSLKSEAERVKEKLSLEGGHGHVMVANITSLKIKDAFMVIDNSLKPNCVNGEMICQDCFSVRPFTERRDDAIDRCEYCGGQFCGCPSCAAFLANLRAGVRSASELDLPEDYTPEDLASWNETTGIFFAEAA